MEEHVRKEIIQVLEKACYAIEHKDFRRMKRISDDTLQNAHIFHDDDSLSVAVLIYALSKIIERIKKSSAEYEQLQSLLHKAHQEFRSGAVKNYKPVVKDLLKLVAEVDHKLKLYIDEVLTLAQVKKSSGLYERGSSVALAAERLGISQWELMSYIGKTQIHDVTEIKYDMKSRLDFARSLFTK